MKADLAQREPAMLQCWESQDIYGESARHRARPAALRAARRPAVCQWRRSTSAMPSTRSSRTSSSSRALWTASTAPYIPGWDCHGLPIELQVEKKHGRVGAEAGCHARSAPPAARYAMEQVDAAAQGLQAPRRVRRLGSPVPDDGPALRSAADPRPGQDHRQRPPLQGRQAGALVPRLPLGAGRSRSGIRGQDLDRRSTWRFAWPTRADFARRIGVAAIECRVRCRSVVDLDHHAVDAAGQRGRRAACGI